MRLFWIECKRILANRLNLLLLVCFCIFSIVSYQRGLEPYTGIFGDGSTSGYVYEDGTFVPKKEAERLYLEASSALTHEIDETWLKKIHEMSDVYDTMADHTIINFPEMEKNYGTDWYHEYLADPDQFEAEHEMIYNEDWYYPVEIIPYSIAKFDYLNYIEAIEKRIWDTEDGFRENTMFDGQTGVEINDSVYNKRELSRQQLELYRNILNQKQSFHYGNDRRNHQILNHFGTIANLLALWIIFAISTTFAKVKKNQIFELQLTMVKVSRYAWIKICSALFSALIAALVLFGSFMIFAAVKGDIGDLAVNMTKGQYYIHLLTYKEGFLLSILTILIGIFAITSISLLCSVLVNKPHLAIFLTVMMLFVMPGVVFVFGDYLSWVSLVSMISDIVMYDFSSVFFGHAVLNFIWVPVFDGIISIVLFLLTWKIYDSHRYRTTGI